MSYDFPNNVALEFDFWKNDETADPNNNHVGYHSNHTTRGGVNGPHKDLEKKMLVSYNPGRNISEENRLTSVTVIYNGTDDGGGIEVYLDEDEDPIIRGFMDFAEYFAVGEDGKAWVGFTASNGGAYCSKNITFVHFWEFNVNASATVVQMFPLPSSLPPFPSSFLLASLFLVDLDGFFVTSSAYDKGSSLSCLSDCPCLLIDHFDGSYDVSVVFSPLPCLISVFVDDFLVLGPLFFSPSPSPSPSSSSTPSSSPPPSSPSPSPSSTSTSSPSPSPSPSTTSTSTPTPSSTSTPSSTLSPSVTP